VSRSVCILTTVHPVSDQRIFHKEARSLVAAGYTVTLIAQHSCREHVREGVRILGLPVTRSRLGRPLNWLRLLYLAWRERADIYHFHDPELLPWGLMIRWITGRPVIYDIHEHNPDTIVLREWIPLPLRVPVSRAFDLLEKLLTRRLDAAIVADDAIEERFRPTVKRLVKLYNYPLKDVFAPSVTVSPMPIPQPRPVQIVYVGLIAPQRGHLLMLDALSSLIREHGTDAGLWLAGRMDSERVQATFEQRLAEDHHLADRVQWFGLIPHEHIPSLLRAASVGWIPFQSVAQLRKNIPTKLFEYMACGLPVVGSDLPPIRRFVEPVQAGLLATPGDAQSHAEQIAYLAQHPDLAQQMGQNGLRAFEVQYNWNSEAKKLLGLYQELVGTPDV
jgi:glycosyltransferase involved in cell wall biosynthesis